MNSSATDVQSEQWSKAVWCSGFGVTFAIRCQCDLGQPAVHLTKSMFPHL